MPVHKIVFLAAILSLTFGSLLCQGAGAQKPPKVLNVADFGAVGDGKTDDQDALTKVFNIASLDNHAIVTFPAGTYLHSGTLEIGGDVTVLGEGATLQGMNASAQTLSLDRVFVNKLNVSAVAGGTAIKSDQDAVFTLVDCKIQGGTDCLDMTSVRNCTIRNCTFLPGTNGVALKVTTCTGIGIENNTFSGSGSASSQTAIQCSGTGITVGTGNTFSNLNFAINATNVNQMKIAGNTFSKCASSISVQNSQTVEIDSNSLANTDRIYVFNSNPVAITKNLFANIQTQAVLSSTNGGTVRIHGNNIINCGLSSSTTPPAVIYSDGKEFVPFKGSLSITDNIYIGNTQNLKYFIETPVSSAKLAGNKTNTILPNKVGP